MKCCDPRCTWYHGGHWGEISLGKTTRTRAVNGGELLAVRPLTTCGPFAPSTLERDIRGFASMCIPDPQPSPTNFIICPCLHDTIPPTLHSNIHIICIVRVRKMMGCDKPGHSPPLPLCCMGTGVQEGGMDTLSSSRSYSRVAPGGITPCLSGTCSVGLSTYP